MNNKIPLLAILLAACGEPTRVANGPDMSSGMTIRAFTPSTRAVAYITDTLGFPALNLVMTDATGAVGCSLSDPSANPGQSVSRVSFQLIDHRNGITSVCPSNAVAIGDNGKGIYDAWDAAGNQTSSVNAVGGATSFIETTLSSGFRCDASVTLTFPHGDIFTDTFSYDYSIDMYGTVTFTKACSN